MRRSSSMIRRLIAASKGPAQSSVAVRELANAYIAGETVDEVAEVARRLRDKGLDISLHYLAREDERRAPQHLLEAAAVLGDDVVGAEFSVRPSSLGLRESASVARQRLDEFCGAVEAADAHVTLEMQAVPDYLPTLDLYRDVVSDHPELAVTVPVNVRRAERDIRRLAEDGARLRLCVGSYPVPRSQGFSSEHEKSRALVRSVRAVMESHGTLLLATHDPRIIAITQELAARNEKGRDDVEFQMLYGVRPLEQRRLADTGNRSRTYLPFGPGWYEYLATRVAARPRTLWSYTRALLDKR